MALGVIERRAYIARYPLANSGNDLDEEILHRDTHCSEDLVRQWDSLISERKSPREPMLQMWYADETGVSCLATTNQPFKLV